MNKLKYCFIYDDTKKSFSGSICEYQIGDLLCFEKTTVFGFIPVERITRC